MYRNWMLRLAGILAIGVAIYHGVTGDAILQTLRIAPAGQFEFVRATYHIGTVGWMAGGVLLIAAANMIAQNARNWIVGVFAVVYGIPAIGSLALSGGKPELGGILLSAVLLLALLGRKHQNESLAPA